MTMTVSNATMLSDLSKALQSLHQHLLQFQARESGFTGTPLQLFKRATSDSAFAWLKPLRVVIVSLDERRADDAPLTRAEVGTLRDHVRGVLDGALGAKLPAAFQAQPEAVVAVGAVRKSLAALD